MKTGLLVLHIVTIILYEKFMSRLDLALNEI